MDPKASQGFPSARGRAAFPEVGGGRALQPHPIHLERPGPPCSRCSAPSTLPPPTPSPEASPRSPSQSSGPALPPPFLLLLSPSPQTSLFLSSAASWFSFSSFSPLSTHTFLLLSSSSWFSPCLLLPSFLFFPSRSHSWNRGAAILRGGWGSWEEACSGLTAPPHPPPRSLQPQEDQEFTRRAAVSSSREG